MAKIEKFENLQSWLKAREMTNQVYDLTSHSAFARNFGLRNQIQNAAGSVMNNIAEGFDAGSNIEFIRFLKIARRSASEVQSQLYIAQDQKYITAVEFTKIYDLATESKRLINGMIAYLRRSGYIKNKSV